MRNNVLLILFILGVILLAGCKANPPETVLEDAIMGRLSNSIAQALKPDIIKNIKIIYIEKKNSYTKLINNEEHTCIEYDAIVKACKENEESRKFKVSGEFAFIKRGNKWEYSQQGGVDVIEE